MSDTLTSGHSWLLTAPRAVLRAGALHGELDVSRPELGVSQLTINQRACTGKLFGVLPCPQKDLHPLPTDHEDFSRLLPRQPADAYVRGGDLVVAYQPTESWPYATQIYWQIADEGYSPGWLSSVSVLVSLQTNLLDTWPTMCIDTHLEADDVVHVDCEPPYENAIHLLPARTHAIRHASGVCCILYRLAGMPISYAEMMRGSDIREVTISRDHGRLHHSRWELFAEFLEKGVIRRARMLSILVPREHDIESARAACNALERRPLPLTT
jgi:hypothetical protein